MSKKPPISKGKIRNFYYILSGYYKKKAQNYLSSQPWERDNTTKLNYYSTKQRIFNQRHPRIVLVNYLFGRILIWASPKSSENCRLCFRGMRNFMSIVFGLIKMSFWVQKKGQPWLSENRIDFREMDWNAQKYLRSNSPKITEQIKTL